MQCKKAKGIKKGNIPRLLILILILLLALTGLSGCKKKDTAEEQPAHQQGTVQESEPEQTQDDAEQESESEESESNQEQSQEQAQDDVEQEQEQEYNISEDGYYYSKDEVALYIHLYGHLPDNYMTKKEAKNLGWSSGSLEKFAPGKVIGGDRFGNYEGNLPDGKNYTECDIDTYQKKKRGAKRIVFSDDGYVYYTEDHYETFELLYEPEEN